MRSPPAKRQRLKWPSTANAEAACVSPRVSRNLSSEQRAKSHRCAREINGNLAIAVGDSEI